MREIRFNKVKKSANNDSNDHCVGAARSVDELTDGLSDLKAMMGLPQAFLFSLCNVEDYLLLTT